MAPGKSLAHAVRNVADTGSAPSLIQRIDAMKPEIQRALPAGLDADRFARVAITVVRKNPDLQACTPESFLGALMLASQLGCEPGPLGHSYLVPFGRECTFILGYKGMIHLAHQAGVSIIAREVRERDHFEVAYGLADRLVHIPCRDGDPGMTTDYYAVARWAPDHHVFLHMTRADVEKHRRRSRAADRGPWVTDYDAMARKTVIRAMSPYLPMVVDLNRALVQDGTVHRQMVPNMVDEPADYLEEMPALEAAPADDALTGEPVPDDLQGEAS